MQKLFFQLIQVSIGQLDCLDRGPSPEEWFELYRLSKKHGLVSTCYDGVIRLFDFGLRAPQDLSIDWMAETEGDMEVNQIGDPYISNSLRRMLYLRWKERNGSSLYVCDGTPRQLAPAAAVIVLLLDAFESFHQSRLTLRSVVDLCLLLRQLDVERPSFRDGSTIPQMLQTFGIWRFSRAMMWTLGQVTALDGKRMVCSPSASDGQFLLDEVMAENMPMLTRTKHRIWKFFKY